MLKKISLAMVVCALVFGEDSGLGGGLEIIKDIEKSNLGVVENYGIDLNENKTTETITSKQMEYFNASNAADSLKYTSGVFYSPPRGQRGEPSFSIRGFEHGKVGIFIDGIPVHSIYDRQTDWAQFGIYDAELIQISKGYVSSLYGANTMGGAINIVTKKPKKALEIDLKAQLSPANMQHAEYLSVGSNLGKVYMSANLSNIKRNYYIMSKSFSPTQFQKNLERVNSYYQNTKIALKLGVMPNESDEYVLNASYSLGNKGGIPSTQSQGNFWDWEDYDKWNVNYIGRTKLGENFLLHTKAWIDSFYNDLKMRGQWNGSEIVTSGRGPRGWSIYDDWTFGAYLGLDYHLSSNDLLKFIYNIKNDNHNNKENNPTNNTKISDLTHYLSAEYTHAFDDKWRLGLTGSFVFNHILNLNLGGQKDSIKSNVYGLNAQAIVYYDPFDYLSFYATIGKKDNIPTMKEKYSERFGGFVPNPNLQTESSLNVEIGGNYEVIKDLNLSLALYYNRYLNALDERDMPNDSCIAGNNCVQFYNVKGFNTHAFGTEVGLQYNFNDKFTTYTSYSYIYKRQRADTNGDRRFSNLPEHLWNLQMIIKPIKEIDIIAGTRLSSKIYQGYNQGFSPMVFLADLKITTRVIENLELGVGVDNLLDRNYYYTPGYNQEGRRIYVELRLKY